MSVREEASERASGRAGGEKACERASEGASVRATVGMKKWDSMYIAMWHIDRHEGARLCRLQLDCLS